MVALDRTMDITIREAAPLLGRSARAVRARIARGELAARRQGRTWLIALDQLPLTDAQRASMQLRAQVAREAVEASLPSRAAATRDRRRRSMLDLAPFAAGFRVLASVRALPAAQARQHLERGLVELGAGVHEFDLSARGRHLRRARSAFSRCAAWLLIECLGADGEPALPLLHSIEHEVLPPLGGLLRWIAERRSRGTRTRA